MVIADYTGVAAGSLTDLVFVHAARAGAPSPRGRESSYLWLRLRWRRQRLRSRLRLRWRRGERDGSGRAGSAVECYVRCV